MSPTFKSETGSIIDWNHLPQLHAHLSVLNQPAPFGASPASPTAFPFQIHDQAA